VARVQWTILSLHLGWQRLVLFRLSVALNVRPFQPRTAYSAPLCAKNPYICGFQYEFLLQQVTPKPVEREPNRTPNVEVKRHFRPRHPLATA